MALEHIAKNIFAPGSSYVSRVLSFSRFAEDARRGRLMSGLRAKINLIPWNPGQLPYRGAQSGPSWKHSASPVGQKACLCLCVIPAAGCLRGLRGKLALSEATIDGPAIAAVRRPLRHQA